MMVSSESGPPMLIEMGPSQTAAPPLIRYVMRYCVKKKPVPGSMAALGHG